MDAVQQVQGQVGHVETTLGLPPEPQPKYNGSPTFLYFNCDPTDTAYVHWPSCYLCDPTSASLLF